MLFVLPFQLAPTDVEAAQRDRALGPDPLWSVVDEVVEAIYQGRATAGQILDLTEAMLLSADPDIPPYVDGQGHVHRLRDDANGRSILVRTTAEAGPALRTFKFLVGALPPKDFELTGVGIHESRFEIAYGIRHGGIEYCACIVYISPLHSARTADLIVTRGGKSGAKVGAVLRFGRDPTWKPITLGVDRIESGPMIWTQGYGPASTPPGSLTAHAEQSALVVSILEAL